MHKWIGTDNGSECIRCGMALDYLPDPGDTDGAISARQADAQSDAAHALAWAFCAEPDHGRGHHLVLIGSGGASGYELDCAYGDAAIGDRTVPGSVNLECIGA